LTLKGNIVLKSNKSIVLNKNNVLEDVLIIAPSVYIKRGFKGTVQIMADKEVDIEEEVSLFYPSSVYVKNDIDSVKVTLQKNSKIAGGIVIDGSTYIGSLKRSLVINEGATVIGNVYCYGKTQLQGEVIGSIYTDRFFLETKSSKYENVILNGSVNRDSLPENFIELPLFENQTKDVNYEIIKAF
jgi:hypothetical protein